MGNRVLKLFVTIFLLNSIFLVALNARVSNTSTAKDDYANLRVTELHYHPSDVIYGLDTISGKKFEFIEFKNTGDTALDFSGFRLDTAVRFTFPQGAILDPGNFFVVASNPSWFYEYYSKIATGNFQGNFSNGGEEVLLTNALGEEIIHFNYADSGSWPSRADGDGYSLVSTEFNPAGDPNDPFYWRASLKIGGSPFNDDDGLSDIYQTEVISANNIKIFPNPATDQISINIKPAAEYQRFNVRFYNNTGLLIHQSVEENNATISLKDLGFKPGIYFVRIETDDIAETLKIVFIQE
jgi:hypothetical protein